LLGDIVTTNSDLIIDSGYNKPLACVKLCDINDIIRTITIHKVILSSLAELSQFKRGFSALGVADELKKHPDALSSFFCKDKDIPLTAGVFSC
jgi:hypothetical protein